MSENGENGTGNGLEMTMEIAGNRSAIAVLKIESKLPFYFLFLKINGRASLALSNSKNKNL